MFIRIVALFIILFFVPTTYAEEMNSDNIDFSQFLRSDENSKLTVNHAHVNYMYGRLIFDLGPSDRSQSNDTIARTGTRLKATRNRLTYLEGARVPFGYIVRGNNLEKIKYLRELLEGFPDKLPLHSLTKNDQIAFWLNLYNVALIEKIATKPINKLKKTLYGNKNILDEKFITVAGMEMSLNDIQFNIVYKMEKQVNPILMYGFFQGVIGSPKIRTTAFSAKNLYIQLADNATDFINSNRGTQRSKWSEKMSVSWYYKHNQILFPNFQTDLKKHLMHYVTGPIRPELLSSDHLFPELTSFNRADLMGGEKQYGMSNNVTVTHPDQFNKEIFELELIRELKNKYRRMEPTVTIEDVKKEEDSN